jgi:hypothetical protein
VVIGGIMLALLLGRPERSGGDERGERDERERPDPAGGDGSKASDTDGATPASRPDPAAAGEADRGTGAEARSRPI